MQCWDKTRAAMCKEALRPLSYLSGPPGDCFNSVLVSNRVERKTDVLPVPPASTHNLTSSILRWVGHLLQLINQVNSWHISPKFEFTFIFPLPLIYSVALIRWIKKLVSPCSVRSNVSTVLKYPPSSALSFFSSSHNH